MVVGIDAIEDMQLPFPARLAEGVLVKAALLFFRASTASCRLGIDLSILQTGLASLQQLHVHP